MNISRQNKQRGVSLIVVVLVTAFLITVGLALYTITTTGTKVSGNMRTQVEAFDAAEAGFEAAKLAIERSFADGRWANFDENCLRDPAGIDQPMDVKYFRRLTDEELLASINATAPGVIFYDMPFIATAQNRLDPRFTYTVFLIDDEAGSGSPDPSDALLICIGTVKAGNKIVSSSRLEILLGVESRVGN